MNCVDKHFAIYSPAHVVILITEACVFLVQHFLRDQRSGAFSIDFQACLSCTENFDNVMDYSMNDWV